MRIRTAWYAVAAAAVSLTSGCHWFRAHFPHVGWRLCNPCHPCGQAPALRPPVVGLPVAGGPAAGVPVVPDCHGCAEAHPPVVHHPAGFPPAGPHPFVYPGAGGYPPIIGQPMPLPGGTPVAPPPSELHRPMPVKPGQN